MTILDTINRFYYDMALNELNLMNGKILNSDITYNSLLYLDLIAYEKNCTASYLAQILHISKSAVTVKINELIRQGLVEKVQSQEDRRIYYLNVTEGVAELYKTYDKKTLFAVDKIEKEFSSEEIQLFCKMMASFSTYYREEESHNESFTE